MGDPMQLPRIHPRREPSARIFAAVIALLAFAVPSPALGFGAEGGKGKGEFVCAVALPLFALQWGLVVTIQRLFSKLAWQRLRTAAIGALLTFVVVPITGFSIGAAFVGQLGETAWLALPLWYSMARILVFRGTRGWLLLFTTVQFVGMVTYANNLVPFLFGYPIWFAMMGGLFLVDRSSTGATHQPDHERASLVAIVMGFILIGYFTVQASRGLGLDSALSWELRPWLLVSERRNVGNLTLYGAWLDWLTLHVGVAPVLLMRRVTSSIEKSGDELEKVS